MNKQLLDILACPVCKSPVRLSPDKQELICRADRLAFPLRDDIPVMLESEARHMDAAELDAGSCEP